jgi:integrase
LVKIVGPHLGNKPIAAIDAPDPLAVLRKLEKRGANTTAHRVRAVCGRVFRYAIATGRAKHDISADSKGALVPKGTISYPAITDPRELGQLLRAIDGFSGQRTTYAAVRTAPYVFVRPGELRGAEWSDERYHVFNIETVVEVILIMRRLYGRKTQDGTCIVRCFRFGDVEWTGSLGG